jgi:hypothetical protein
MPVTTAVSGFFKVENSLWKKKESKSFSFIAIPQDVIDIVEEGVFRSSVGGPVQPGQEVAVRLGPRALIPAEGRFLPLPMYLWVQNNVRTPQPSFKPLN